MKCLNFFKKIKYFRNAKTDEIIKYFDDAYNENKLLATKIVFYARDIKCGAGERQLFRVLINHMAINYPESIKNNIQFIGLYGRFDDLYSLIHTPLEKDMWLFVKSQLESDTVAMMNNKEVSLLAKWLKTADASSEKTRKLGIYTAKKLGYKVYVYKRIIRSLRKYIQVTESLMSTGKWDRIDYELIPSKAMNNYKNAFIKHDKERFDNYISLYKKNNKKERTKHFSKLDEISNSFRYSCISIA